MAALPAIGAVPAAAQTTRAQQRSAEAQARAETAKQAANQRAQEARQRAAQRRARSSTGKNGVVITISGEGLYCMRMRGGVRQITLWCDIQTRANPAKTVSYTPTTTRYTLSLSPSCDYTDRAFVARFRGRFSMRVDYPLEITPLGWVGPLS